MISYMWPESAARCGRRATSPFLRTFGCLKNRRISESSGESVLRRSSARSNATEAFGGLGEWYASQRWLFSCSSRSMHFINHEDSKNTKIKTNHRRAAEITEINLLRPNRSLCPHFCFFVSFVLFAVNAFLNHEDSKNTKIQMNHRRAAEIAEIDLLLPRRSLCALWSLWQMRLTPSLK